MNWLVAKKFKVVKTPGHHYVFHQNSKGKVKITVPTSVVTQAQAIAWILKHQKPLFPEHPKNVWSPVISGSPVFTNTPPTEYHAISPPYVLKTDNWSASCNSIKKSIKAMRAAGSGRQGKVYVAKMKSTFAIKVVPYDIKARQRNEPQPAEIEFTIQKVVSEADPSGVVAVFKYARCPNFVSPAEINMANVQNPKYFDKAKQGVIFMEYCTGKSFKSWFATTKQKNDSMMRHLIGQIVRTLYRIQLKYPEFRHNDLHTDNVFVAPRGFLIGDFGWARLRKFGTNPAVNSANGTNTSRKYGIGPSTDPRYDHHLFLNELREIAIRNPLLFPKTAKFLNEALPVGYRGANDTHVSEFRLKYKDPCADLPSLRMLLRMPFLTGYKNASPRRPFTGANLLAMKAKLKTKKKVPFTGVNLLAMKAKLKTKKKVPFTGANLLAMKAKLRTTKPVPVRIKVKNPATGRMVYADGRAIKLKNLKKLATQMGVNTKGLRKKVNIAKKIYKL